MSHDTASPAAIHLSSAESGHAKRRRELLSLIKHLRAIGAQADFDLPHIAVIGNQSAGKSSLVEAISGITVPRDAGTCTRCPIECRLSNAPEWSCQVSIRLEFDNHGQRKRKVEEITFGGPIRDKTAVELALRRAQAAALNPSLPISSFVEVSAEMIGCGQFGTERQLLFSRNAVCLDVYGPDLTELSFIDLPLVEELVRHHIGGQRLILLTIPMSDDIENQKAVRLAKDVDPDGIRTIGVLTKPDTIPSGATNARRSWLEIIEGQKHPLKHGYYCTKQPDDADRAKRITSTEAREAEQKFFNTSRPWSESAHRQRFGTGNLVANLSRLLTGLIHDIVPVLRDEVERQLQDCEKQLSELPPPLTTDPPAAVLSLVTSFCNDVNSWVQGGPNTADLVQNIRKIHKDFKTTIRRTAPHFVIHVQGERIPVRDQGIDLRTIFTSGGPITLGDIHEHMESCVTRELPNNVPYRAKITLIDAFMTHWEDHALNMFVQVYNAFVESVEKLVKTRFGRFKNLEHCVKLVVAEQVKAHRDETCRFICKLLKLESTPFSQNTHYLAASKDKHLALYKDMRAGKMQVPSDSSLPSPAKRQKMMYREVSDTIFDDKEDEEESNDDSSSSTTSELPTPPKRAEKTKAKAASNSLTLSPSRESTSRFVEQLPKNPPSKKDQQSTNVLDKAAAPAAAPATPCASVGGSQAAKPVAIRPIIDDTERAEAEAATLASLAKLGYHCTLEDLGKLNPPDIYEEELQLMAEVRGYFQVAYKASSIRIIDNIPLAIDHTFLFAFADALQDHLIEKLGLGSEGAAARCAAYVSEDADVARMRMELSSKKDRLFSIKERLFEFEQSQ
ncbi:P-loop containing nucleoside triphosphate hydrolase protein [Laetiporus sulphureus 93-53]|uniref:p-loop containing nucleoside triphosphate hydrolase protein n=1 Tax=Laetiporus sulphureus 93-53 TaxID=1314785 RepID=A0A165GJI0_9APHY|nr:P-loop containing nucleoside triphosphate hydrolase protein [Laetiporus sulphureus 93-53]KZT10439.1 P-loop containing nucleoside triphosphate hydrolase protein [Laetiporus sulphureus 93-53]